MTIKVKLTLNVAILIIIVAGVAVTSIVAMGFVKSRLQDLTQRSTPFQMRTVEYQRAIQGVTADLTKVSASRSRTDYQASKDESEKSLAEVQKAQSALQAIAGDTKVEAYEELNVIASELTAVTEGRLKADEDAVAARKTISERLREATGRLKELDAKIKGLQASTSTSYTTSMEQTTTVSVRSRSVEALKLTLKDFQLGFLETMKAQSKKGVLISQGKCNSALGKGLQSEFLKSAPAVAADMKVMGEKLPLLMKAQTALVSQPGGESAARDQVAAEITDRLNAVLLALEQEGAMASDRLNAETHRQSSYFGSSTLATSVMAGNSELLSLGLNVEGLASRLFTVGSAQEVDAVQGELSRIFARIDAVKGGLAKSLVQLNARREGELLRTAGGSLGAVQGSLFVKDGVIAKIRHRLEMEAKAAAAMEKLREMVLKQAEKGKQTVSVAQVDQEKAIATVNSMVRMSTGVIAAIGLGAALFGIIFGAWIYRSISRPLAELLRISHAVAGGDLAVKIETSHKDEVGLVQIAMAEMVENLRKMVAKIQGATDSLASSSEELSATAVALERGSEEQTGRIDQSATAMTQMTQTTVEVARNTSDTSDAAVKMKHLAAQGKGAMYTTGKELDSFVLSVQAAADKVESLGKQSEEISEIVTMISDIADQTNLLALNAAIEAARAGEQGKGFAVVADNVRHLAEQTSNATNDIYKTVKAMQTSVKSSVNYMQEERESVRRVQGQVQETLRAMDEIASYVERVTDMVQRIAVAAEEQSATSEGVSQNMEGIFSIARELRSSFVDIKNSSGSLSHLASDLNSLVGWFRV